MQLFHESRMYNILLNSKQNSSFEKNVINYIHAIDEEVTNMLNKSHFIKNIVYILAKKMLLSMY